MPDYLHNHPEFTEFLRFVGHQKNIDYNLVEKDYWIMHALYGLQKHGFNFELKGGTSLSKGYGIIHRFSEDIDIRINPPPSLDVKTGKNHTKPLHRESRKKFYDWLASNIKVDGVEKVCRDNEFDNEEYTSGGIRLYYKNAFPIAEGLKEGILLEVGFDNVTPNNPATISSWAIEFAQEKDLDVVDNKAYRVKCYAAEYTLVEKLQAIVTKFRKYKETGKMPANFIRHYYDVACLLKNENVQKFIGTEEYKKHKEKRFPAIDKRIPLNKQEAFILSNKVMQEFLEKEYKKTAALYYQGQLPFPKILELISENLEKL